MSILAVTPARFDEEGTPLLIPALPHNPVERLKAIIQWLQIKPKNQRLNCCLRVVDRTTLRRQTWNPCGSNDPSTEIRVPNVVNALFQFCQTHQEELNKEQPIWLEIQKGILEPLNTKTLRRHAKSIGIISDEICKLAKKASSFRWPDDRAVFPHLPIQAPELIERAYRNPWRYQLICYKTGPKGKRSRMLILTDLIRDQKMAHPISYSLRKIDLAENNHKWVLVSKKTAGEGAFTKARICWDLSSGKYLVQKSKGIYPEAQRIILQIAEKKIPGVVPMWVAETDKWRMYETYCQMDLFTMIKHKSLALEAKYWMTLQLLTILSNLHEHEYRLRGTNTCPAFHGDIKPENILYTCQNQLVFTDFGSTHPDIANGTYLYAAPEILDLYQARDQGKKLTLDKKSRQAQDVWSMGVLLAQFLNGGLRNFISCIYRIAVALERGNFSDCSISQEELDRDLATFKSLLDKNQKTDRKWDLDWKAPIWSCIERMLRVDPQERISAKDALALFHRAN